MSLANSKIVPAAVWVGFLALGFVTSLGGPNKSQTHVLRPVKAPAAIEAVVAQTERPAAATKGVRAARD